MSEPTQPCADCGPPVPGVKPPPIRIQIEGFDTHEPMAAVPAPINWFKLTRLPAFELFIAEHYPNVGRNMSGMPLTDELYRSYCGWHRARGQWPNETPMGELIEPEPAAREE